MWGYCSCPLTQKNRNEIFTTNLVNLSKLLHHSALGSLKMQKIFPRGRETPRPLRPHPRPAKLLHECSQKLVTLATDPRICIINTCRLHIIFRFLVKIRNYYSLKERKSGQFSAHGSSIQKECIAPFASKPFETAEKIGDRCPLRYFSAVSNRPLKPIPITAVQNGDDESTLPPHTQNLATPLCQLQLLISREPKMGIE